MVRGSGAHYLRQKLWKCEDAGSFATIIIESASPCTNNMANDTAIDDEEHQEATCQEGTLSGPQDVIPTKKRPRSSTPDTGDLRPVVLQEVLADQMQMPLPTADRKFKFIEGDWFVRMPVSYSTSMHKKVWFFTARAGTITLAARDRVLWCSACGLAHHCGPQCSCACHKLARAYSMRHGLVLD